MVDDLWSRETAKLEAEAATIQELSLNYRSVCLRLPLVLEPSGGVLRSLLDLFKWGFGAPLADGPNSWFPWIHIYDVVRLVLSALDTETFQGALNCMAGAVTHEQLAKALAVRTGSNLYRWKRIPTFLIQSWFGKPSAVSARKSRSLVCFIPFQRSLP